MASPLNVLTYAQISTDNAPRGYTPTICLERNTILQEHSNTELGKLITHRMGYYSENGLRAQFTNPQATQCNAVQRSATHCNTLQHTATNMLHHTLFY